MKVDKRTRVSAATLKAYGYTYKMEVLTKAEKNELKNGRIEKDAKGKVITEPNGKPKRFEARDFDYFFKRLEKGECRIYHAGGNFYYGDSGTGSRLSRMSHVVLAEARATEKAMWNEAIAKLPNTPIIAPITTSSKLATGEMSSDQIHLMGGPLDGHIVKYPRTLPLYAAPYSNNGIEGIARYKRNPEDNSVYNFFT